MLTSLISLYIGIDQLLDPGYFSRYCSFFNGKPWLCIQSAIYTSLLLPNRERNKQFHLSTFEEENEHQQVRNQLRGARRVRLIHRTQEIEPHTVHFGFNRLTSSGGLPQEVQRKLRDLRLIAESTRIRRSVA